MLLHRTAQPHCLQLLHRSKASSISPRISLVVRVYGLGGTQVWRTSQAFSKVTAPNSGAVRLDACFVKMMGSFGSVSRFEYTRGSGKLGQNAFSSEPVRVF